MLRGLKIQRQVLVSPLPFAILAKAFPADSSTAHKEASSRSVFDMTGCLPGLSSSKGPFLSTKPSSPIGDGALALLLLHCQMAEQS